MHGCLAARLLMIVALGAAGDRAWAQTPEGAPLNDPLPQLSLEKVYALDASHERVLQEFSIPGLAVGIVENGVPVYVRAFGRRDKQTTEPVNIHTLFHVGSITKTFSAAAIMQLAERKQLDLDDPVARHVPAFSDSAITIRQLLTRSDAVFNVLGAVIESVSGQSYSQYLKTQVLAATRMNESTFAKPSANDNNAWPHTGKMFVRRAESYPWDRASLPSAGLNSSVTDMTHWAALHLTRDPSLLAPASSDAMFKQQLDSKRKGMAMGLGWELEQRGNGWLPRQAGEEHGFSSLLTLYPEQQRAIVILSNGETTPHTEIRTLIEAVLAGGAFVPLQPPLLSHPDFQWTLGGLVALTLLLVAMTVRRGRRS